MAETGIEGSTLFKLESGSKGENRYPHLTTGFLNCLVAPNFGRSDIKSPIFSCLKNRSGIQRALSRQDQKENLDTDSVQFAVLHVAGRNGIQASEVAGSRCGGSGIHRVFLRWKRENKPTVLFTCIGYPSSFFAVALDLPAFTVFNQPHFGSLSPPTIHFTRSCCPDALFFPQARQETEQSLIYGSLRRSDHIVWVDNEADQSVLLHDDLDLLFPKIDRKIIENIKQGVILSCGDW